MNPDTFCISTQLKPKIMNFYKIEHKPKKSKNSHIL